MPSPIPDHGPDFTIQLWEATQGPYAWSGQILYHRDVRSGKPIAAAESSNWETLLEMLKGGLAAFLAQND